MGGHRFWGTTFTTQMCVYTNLTHWGRDKIVAISMTTFSNAYSGMRMHGFRLGYRWRLFVRFKSTIFQHWFREWLGADQARSHYLKQRWLICWCIETSVSLNELNGILEAAILKFRGGTAYSVNSWNKLFRDQHPQSKHQLNTSVTVKICKLWFVYVQYIDDLIISWMKYNGAENIWLIV